MLDGWRAMQRPIPSQSEAIRNLVLRSIASDAYLAEVLKSSITELISAGVVFDRNSPETYRRLKEVILHCLDDAGQVDLENARSKDQHQRRPETIPEMREANMSSPKRKQGSR